MDFADFLTNYWGFTLTVIAVVIWLIRLEGKVNRREDLCVLKHQGEEKAYKIQTESFVEKLDDIKNSVDGLRSDISKIMMNFNRRTDDKM
jgi:hypothetical protein